MRVQNERTSYAIFEFAGYNRGGGHGIRCDERVRVGRWRSLVRSVRRGRCSNWSLEGASLVVSFDQNIAATVDGRVRQLNWDDLPPVLTNYARGRDAIVMQVDSLIEVLARGRSP